MSMAELPTLLQAQVQAVPASPRELAAYGAGALAACLVIGAAFVRTMIPLRRLAVAGSKVFGEIAFFAPDRRRTLSARCVGTCTVLSIDEVTLKQRV